MLPSGRSGAIGQEAGTPFDVKMPSVTDSKKTGAPADRRT
jgi:hypothetical protein